MSFCAKNGLGFAVVLGVSTISSVSWSATPPPRAPVVEAVVSCRAIVANDERLACFDKAVAALTAAETAGDVVTIDREQRRAVRRQAFGLALPSLTIFDRGEEPEEVNRLTVTGAEVSKTLYGRWILKLDDGAVWRQTDDYELLKAPRKGSTAVISKGSLGSFYMKVDGQQAIKVHRDS
jgi:hypothetical protein